MFVTDRDCFGAPDSSMSDGVEESEWGGAEAEDYRTCQKTFISFASCFGREACASLLSKQAKDLL